MSGTGGAELSVLPLSFEPVATPSVTLYVYGRGFGHDLRCLPISRESGTFSWSAVFFAMFAVALDEEMKGLVGAAGRPGNIGSQKLLYVGGIGGMCDVMRCGTQCGASSASDKAYMELLLA